MKNKIIFITIIFLIIVISFTGSVFSKEIVINETNYHDYFDDEGRIQDLTEGIKENDTLKLSNLDKKTIILDKKLVIDRENSKSIFSNGYIKLIQGSDGSVIKNLNIKGVYDPFKNSPQSVLIIENSENNIIQKIFFNITSSLGTISSVNCINIKGYSENNKILDNLIYFNSLSESLYSYGISLSSNYIKNTLISGNTINMRCKNYVAGISSSAENTTIEKNNISLYSNLMYGIYIEGSSAIYIKILNNNIVANGEIFYLIESWMGSNTTISNNVLTGIGKGGFAYAAKFSKYDIITSNIITVKGSDVSNIDFSNNDEIKGHGGIYYAGNSGYATITNNKIISYYKKGEDYAIKSISSSDGATYTIIDNYLYSNNGLKIGNSALSMDKVGNYLNNGPQSVIIYINNFKGFYGKFTKLTAILKDSHGKAISGKIIKFYVNNKFIGQAITNVAGLAAFNYKVMGAGSLTVGATFEGDNSYVNSSKISKFAVPNYSVLKIKNIKSIKKRIVTFKTNLANLGPSKSSFKVTYKLSKGFTYKKPKISVGSVKFNKKTRILTWIVKNLKVHKTKSATLTMKLKAKKGKYTLKPIVKNNNFLKVSSNNLLKSFSVK